LNLEFLKLRREIDLLVLRMKGCRNLSTFASVTAGLPDDFLLQKIPASLNCSNELWMFFTCGGFLLNSFLNLHLTLAYEFAAAKHKTYCAFSLSANIINSVQRRQRQTDRQDTETSWRCTGLRWGNLVCEKKTIRAMESSFATSAVLLRTSPI